MSYYRECPRCGTNLDPGERCDCIEQEKQKKAFEEKADKLIREDAWIQLELQLVV